MITECAEDEISLLEDSTDRMQAMEDGLANHHAEGSLRSFSRVLRKPPVRNDESHQQMVFCPRTGELLAWAGK